MGTKSEKTTATTNEVRDLYDALTRAKGAAMTVRLESDAKTADLRKLLAARREGDVVYLIRKRSKGRDLYLSTPLSAVLRACYERREFTTRLGAELGASEFVRWRGDRYEWTEKLEDATRFPTEESAKLFVGGKGAPEGRSLREYFDVTLPNAEDALDLPTSDGRTNAAMTMTLAPQGSYCGSYRWKFATRSAAIADELLDLREDMARLCRERAGLSAQKDALRRLADECAIVDREILGKMNDSRTSGGLPSITAKRAIDSDFAEAVWASIDPEVADRKAKAELAREVERVAREKRAKA